MLPFGCLLSRTCCLLQLPLSSLSDLDFETPSLHSLAAFSAPHLCPGPVCVPVELLQSKAMQVDYRIVEVALFFNADLLKAQAQGQAAQAQGQASPSAVGDGNGGSSGSDAAAAAAAAAAASNISLFPVMLLSNDNAQVTAAKAHGLPAFRISSPTSGDAAVALQRMLAQPGVALTSQQVRTLAGPTATAGLGASAGKSLQSHFDSAVACLRALLGSHNIAAAALQSVAALLGPLDPGAGAAAVASGDAAALTAALRQQASAIQQVQTLLHLNETSGSVPSSARQLRYEETARGEGSREAPAGDQAEAVDAASEEGVREGAVLVRGPTLPESLAEMAALVEGQMAEWETVVKTHQSPSRVSKWAASPGAAAAGSAGSGTG